MAGIDQGIADVIDQVSISIDLAVFGLLALIGLIRFARRREAGSAWFATMFAVITLAIGLTLVLADDHWLPIAMLALVPMCLYRFMRVFAAGTTITDVGTSLLTVVIVAWTAVVDLPVEGEPWSPAAIAYTITFLAHWIGVSGLAAWFFLRQAARTRGVARRRMRAFGYATIALGLALLMSALAGDPSQRPIAAIIVNLMGVGSALAFLVALAPPRFLRLSWRSHELESMQGGLRWIVQGETVDDVLDRALDAIMLLTGATGAIYVDEQGAPRAWAGLDHGEATRIATEAAASSGSEDLVRTDSTVVVVDNFLAVCGIAAPFFDDSERQLLGTIGAFAELAQDRARTLDAEREANERLRQVDQLKTEFVAMVAHDLRSPMSVITGFADTIHDRWDILADEQKLEFLRLISRNTRSLAEFVEDVLQVARMESGELHYDMQAFDARKVVDRIVAEMRVTHPELTLTIDAPDQLPPALGDADRNWQILTNLVSNAVKFSNGDPRVDVQLTTRDSEGCVAIAVRDNGVGIATEDLPRLFRRFSRVGPTRRTVAGTGLGLYIVKSMVEAQGGRIWVDSRPGEGSTFTYTLPIAREGSAA